VIGWDCETKPFAPSRRAPPLASVQTTEPGGGVFLSSWARPDSCRALVERVLADELQVSAFGSYDYAAVMAAWPDLTLRIFDAFARGSVSDVLLREKFSLCARGMLRVAQQGFKVSLDVITKRHLGVDLVKGEGSWQTRFDLLRETPVEAWPTEAADYACKDVRYLLPLRAVQETDLQNFPGLFDDEPRQLRAEFALHLASCYGLRTDLRSVQALASRWEAERKQLHQRLVPLGLVRPDGSRNTKLAKRLLLETAQDFQLKLTLTGKEKVRSGELTRAEALSRGFVSMRAQDLESVENPLLSAYGRYSGFSKKLGTDLPILLSGTALPIHPKFETLMETGRTSCRAPNLQNLSRDAGVRECFRPRPGYVYLVADWDKAELVTLAQHCLDLFGFSRLAEVLRDGLDPHTQVAAQILGVPYEVATAMKAAGDPRVDAPRLAGKAANFGFNGGSGIDTFREYAWTVYGVLLTEFQARSLKGSWQGAYPEMPWFHRWVAALIDAGEDCYRLTRSGRYRGGLRFTTLANQVFQGPTADAGKLAVWEITRRAFCEPQSALYGSHVINFVHDEVNLETPIGKARAAAVEVEEIMKAAYLWVCPDVPVGVTAMLTDRLSKLVKPVYDEDGELEVWTPPLKRAA
jgi:DNA polymerase-1